MPTRYCVVTCLPVLAVLPAIMALAMPEKVVATGVHQTYGACAQAVVDLFGYTRAKFLCRESYDEVWVGCMRKRVRVL